MNNELTELVFILDRSGSMAGLETDTIGGYNSMLKKQQEQEGDTLVTTVLFDDKFQLLHDRVHLEDLKPITEKDYFVRGSTALFDAMGMSIKKISGAQNKSHLESRTPKTIFVIITDGMENASKEYSSNMVRALIEEHKQQGWEFIFLAANIDAAETAGDFGISPKRTANYLADGPGTSLNYRVISSAISDFRKGTPLKENWKQEIDEDYNKRKE